ncbi:hypothetical protein VNO78_25242 [Psophocarpus tetragonolobus]|uniref:Uncharacterized protein n=1 Tax=Psophocarpus tetragonolobus TaxID=3891 RepID=A0AAN9S712_PSOTE
MRSEAVAVLGQRGWRRGRRTSSMVSMGLFLYNKVKTNWQGRNRDMVVFVFVFVILAWKHYLKIRPLTRECAYKIQTLNNYLNPEIQNPYDSKSTFRDVEDS